MQLMSMKIYIYINQNRNNALLNNDAEVDIRSQQENLNKRFASLTLSPAAEIETTLGARSYHIWPILLPYHQ